MRGEEGGESLNISLPACSVDPDERPVYVKKNKLLHNGSIQEKIERDNLDKQKDVYYNIQYKLYVTKEALWTGKE